MSTLPCLFNDITEGVSGFVTEGDVGGLLKNVAHGAANSAAKVTGSLSYGISKATVFDKYNDKRLMLRKQRGDGSKEYLVDGLKGLGFGVFQGLTSIVTETYEGVSTEGFSGLFSGLTWGLIGTVSKPAIGVLDLATAAATAVKESSRSRNRELPGRLRLPRLVQSADGHLPNYTQAESRGQHLMRRLASSSRSEDLFLAHHLLRNCPGECLLHLFITSGGVYVCSSFNQEDQDLSVIKEVSFEQLVRARCLFLEENKCYLQLEGQDSSSRKRPQVRCDDERLAQQVCQEINDARELYEEHLQAVFD